MKNLQTRNILRPPLPFPTIILRGTLKDMELEVKKEWLRRVHALRIQTEGREDYKPMVIFSTVNG